MIDITLKEIESDLQPYSPETALIIYRQKGQQKYYIEKHGIVLEKGNLKWSAGLPLNPEDIAGITEACSTQKIKKLQTGGMLPSNLIYFEQTGSIIQMCWYLTPHKRELLFTKGSGKNAKYSLTVNLPRLLFCINDGELSVFALKGKQRPSEATKLFIAPFMNINEDGLVCLGNFRRSNSIESITDEMNFWETAFFKSRFNHWQVDKPLKISADNYFKKLHNTSTAFSEDLLMPSKTYKNLEDLLNEW